LQEDLHHHHAEVKREVWISAILGRDVKGWAEGLQGLKSKVKADLACYMAASSKSQYYGPFAHIANDILLKCKKHIEASGSQLPDFPVNDLRFYKSKTVVLKGDHDGKGHLNRKPDVVALRSNRLDHGALRHATQMSDQLHWSDVLLTVEFKASKNVVSLDFGCLSCLSAPLTHAALPSLI